MRMTEGRGIQSPIDPTLAEISRRRIKAISGGPARLGPVLTVLTNLPLGRQRVMRAGRAGEFVELRAFCYRTPEGSRLPGRITHADFELAIHREFRKGSEGKTQGAANEPRESARELTIDRLHWGSLNDWGQLVRLPNVFTLISDCVAAAVVTGTLIWPLSVFHPHVAGLVVRLLGGHDSQRRRGSGGGSSVSPTPTVGCRTDLTRHCRTCRKRHAHDRSDS